MLAAGQPSAGCFTALAHDTQPGEFGLEQRDRAQFRIAVRRGARHAHALLLRGRNLVTDALAGDLALELGEGEQHVERQAPHGGRRVELLRHRHEGCVMGVEDVDDLGKICERPRQSVDLVDNDGLNPAGLDVLQKPLERRPLHRPAGKACPYRKLYPTGAKPRITRCLRSWETTWPVREPLSYYSA